MFLWPRQEVCGSKDVQVRFEINVAHPTGPEPGPWLQRWQVLFLQSAQLNLFEQSHRGNVVERSKHSRYIAQGRAFYAPLAQGPAGFALKIDKFEIFAGEEHLSQMQITMATNALGLQRRLVDCPQTSHELRLQGQDLLGFSLNWRRQTVQRASQLLQIANRKITHRLKKSSLIERREWFRGEIAGLLI